MPGFLDQLAEGSSVLIIRLRSLGDCVLTTPAIQLLREYRPDLRIGVVAEDRFAGVFEENPAIHAVIQPSKRQVIRFRPKLAINFHGGSRSAVLTAMSLAPWRAGFGHFLPAWPYNLKIPRAQQILGQERTVHTAEHLASAMFWLGVPKREIPRASLYTSAPARDGAYAVMHPFASAAEKAWPADKFAETARRIRDEFGLPVVITGGPGDDFSAFDGFEKLQGAPLRELKALMKGASLFAGNDSGPAHVAAAFGVPVAVLFGMSNPVIWAPWRTKAEVIHSPEGLRDMPVECVMAAVKRLRES